MIFVLRATQQTLEVQADSKNVSLRDEDTLVINAPNPLGSVQLHITREELETLLEKFDS